MHIALYRLLNTRTNVCSCSFLRFLLRALLQLTFLSPKPEGVPPPPIQSGNRPVIFVILANITCIIIHAVSTPPSGGEATRGYLHGGVAMDFIGQKGPSSRIHLILLDLLVLLLQILCFGVSTTRIKAKKSAEEPESSGTSDRPNAAPRQEQTLDFEERGQLASEHRPEDIELRDLNPPGPGTGLEDREEAETIGLLSSDQSNNEGRLRALDSRPDRSDQDLYILDAFFSGEAVVGSLSPPRIIREQLALAVLAEQAAANSSQTSSGDPGMVPRSGMFGVRMQVGDRIFRI